MTYWFPQRRLAQNFAMFLTAIPVANIIGAPLSGVILDHIHWFGLGSWRWLLILEGIPAILGGVLTYFFLPARPAEAKFLTAQEKTWISAELAHQELQKRASNEITVLQALAHRRVWHLTAIYFPGTVGWYATAFWMPQLIKAISKGYSNTTVGALVTIPYLVALAAMVLVGRSSDLRLERRYHAAIPLIIGAISFLALSTISTHSVFLSVALWCLVASGIQCAWSPIWSLPNEFLTGFSAAAGIAFINSVGNLGGFVGPYTMGAMSKATGSFHGGLVFAGISWLISATLLVVLPTGVALHAARGAPPKW